MAPAARTDAAVARHAVAALGGRFSLELGIDVDRASREVERWFLAATLFGARISAAIAGATFHVLDEAGVRRITEARARRWDELVALLDAGGYARYDYRTATRLQSLADVVSTCYGGSVATIGRRFRDPDALIAALDELPGWGPVTIRLFLRELRGVWAGAVLPLDPAAVAGARHLRLLPARCSDPLDRVMRLARSARLDVRDIEASLVRVDRAHRRRPDCPGGPACRLLAS